MALGAVEMMRFLHYTGNFKRYFSVYSNRCTLRPKCRKKFSDYAGKPYGSGIFANGAV